MKSIVKEVKAEVVPLKKVCAQANVDPRIARRLLRARGKRPAGRWQWKTKEAGKIVAWLKENYHE